MTVEPSMKYKYDTILEQEWVYNDYHSIWLQMNILCISNVFKKSTNYSGMETTKKKNKKCG